MGMPGKLSLPYAYLCKTGKVIFLFARIRIRQGMTGADAFDYQAGFTKIQRFIANTFPVFLQSGKARTFNERGGKRS
jgi:hypothetical protein